MPKIFPLSSYDRHTQDRLEGFAPGLSADFGRVCSLPEEEAEKALAYTLSLACGATHDRLIKLGRECMSEVDREWLIDRIERIADVHLNLEDEWEYRRLLELYRSLDGALLERLVARGMRSGNPEIVEAAQDFSE